MSAAEAAIERWDPSWVPHLQSEARKPYFKELASRVSAERHAGTVYPPAPAVFRALRLTPLQEVRCVILGQDPYHGPGQADGLAFSVPRGVKPPPSLRNILKELVSDLGLEESSEVEGDLSAWAEDGVLLLNASLTVRAGEASSHSAWGWQRFTDRVIECVSQRSAGASFVLWGAHAQSKRELINAARHLILEAPHPSPLSAYRGFFGSRPFTQTNEWLRDRGREGINWESVLRRAEPR